MRRIIYSPEVQVYIQPGGFDSNKNPLPPIDISNDIIEGSITRKSDDISTAHFLVQNRRLGGQSGSQDGDFSPPQTLLLSNLRPMDRIVVYLKKTKPILVFSGYLDLVPMLQFVPEPVTIEASCTLKRLEFTYWDPTLPSVMENLMSIGLVPSSAGGDQGLSILQIPANDTSISGIQDTGFPKLIQFLLQDVGGWADKNVFIEPIPSEWMEKALLLFNELKGSDTNTTDTATRAFLSSILGASASDGNNNGVSDSAQIDGSDVAAKIASYIKNKVGNAPVTAQDFVTAGQKYNIDPRFLVVLSLYETGIGTNKNSQAGTENDMFGLGRGRHFPSLAAGIIAIAQALREGGPDGYAYPLKKYPKFNVKQGIASWNQGNPNSSAVYETSFINDYQSLGGNPNKPYTITDQGIGTSTNGGGASLTNRSTSAPRGDVSKKNSKDTLTVYIEAFDCGIPDMRMPGYQDKDILGRAMDTDVRKRVVDYNVTLATMVKSELTNLANKDNKSFDITLGTDNSRLNGYEGFNGDVFLTIDHSDWVYSISTDADGHKASDIQRGFCFTANQYSSGLTAGRGGAGAAWRLPNTVGGRKTNAANEKPLVTNSNALLKAFKDAYTGKPFNATLEGDGHSVSVGPFTIPDFNPVIDDPHNFIPGFYYSTATACMYLELPTLSLQIPSGTGDNTSLNDNSDLKKLFQMRAKQIAQGLYNYWKNYKNKGSQKAVSAGDFSQTTNTNSTNNTSSVPADGNGSSVVGSEKFFNPLGDAKWSSQGTGPGIGTHSFSESPTNWQSDWAVDMAVPKGTPVFAPFSGVAVRVGRLSSTDPRMEGIRIGLQGDNGYCAYLAHLDSVSIKEGDRLKGGQQVGLSGIANGLAHLHFAMAKTSDYGNDSESVGVDPNKWLTGASTNVSAGGTGDGSTGGTGASGGGSGISIQDTLNAAFNVSFNFPGSMADSLILRGQRALENDVPLIDSVAEAVKASMRSFSSLPDGSFVAWYPDYFNISKRTAWLKISPMELKSCTINLSDKSLATHVYILGNPHGIGSLPEAAAASTWLEKLRGTGVVTIEQSKILDSFVGGNGFDDYLDFLDYNGLPKTNSKQVTVKDKRKKKKRTRTVESQISDKVSAPLAFLERYGARPYVEPNLTIRHPLFEFFYAYHTFIRKWAEQFVSTVEFTFMPELFPGMIIEIDDPHRRNITFYVQDVTHNFSYESGFNTSATLIAPGVATKGKITQKNPAYGMIPVTLQAAVPADSESDNNTSSNTTSGNGHRNKRNIPTYKQWLKKHHWGATPARKKQYDKLYKKNKE